MLTVKPVTAPEAATSLHSQAVLKSRKILLDAKWRHLQVIAYSGSCFTNLAHKVGFQLHQHGERKALSFSCVLLALHSVQCTGSKETVSCCSQFVVGSQTKIFKGSSMAENLADNLVDYSE